MNGICIIFFFGRIGIVVFDADVAVRKAFNEFLQLGIYLFCTIFLTLFHVELHHGNHIVGSILTGEVEIYRQDGSVDSYTQEIFRLLGKGEGSSISYQTLDSRAVAVTDEDILVVTIYPFALVGPLYLIHSFQLSHVVIDSILAIPVICKVFIILINTIVKLIEVVLSSIQLLFQGSIGIRKLVILLLQGICLGLVTLEKSLAFLL